MKRKHLAIVVILIFFLIIGIIVVSDYGESWDEYFSIDSGDITLQNYINLFSTDEELYFGPYLMEFYGPLFDLIVHIGTQIIRFVLPSISIITSRHFYYYLSFLVGAGSLYAISVHLFKTKTAIFTTVLFITQPVLWGHAFINPKDIPFMGAFLFSIAMGIHASDKISPLVSSFKWGIGEEIINKIKVEWKGSRKKRTILIWASIFLISVFIIWLSRNQIYVSFERLVYGFYENERTFFGSQFFRFAANARNIPAISYITKIITILKRFFIYYLAGGCIVFLVWSYMSLSETRKTFQKQKFIDFIKDFFTSIKNPWIILVGISIGAATAIRVIGPFAGLLISLYFFVVYKGKSFQLILATGVIAFSATIVFWPYLWISPFGHFIESITVMAKFPWPGTALLNGVYYPSDGLPRSYLPLLFSIQFTEPLLVIFFIGLIIGFKQLFFKMKNWELWLVVFCWFFVPFTYFTINPSSLYDNFRQLLFFVPPIFIIGGLAIDFLLEKIKSNFLQWFFLLLILVPGILALIRLHPYQYIYYNSFIGGQEGAFRRFEMDYWETSFGEATEFLNEYAGENSRILVWGSSESVARIARDDLIVEALQGGTFDQETGYDFGIQSTRWNRDVNNFPDAPILFSIEKDGAVLVVVKQLRCTEINPCP